MKTVKIMLSIIALLLTTVVISQTDDSIFLKDYKAPDFKYKRLGINFQSRGNGKFNENSKLNINGLLRYYSFLNSKKKQSSENYILSTRFNYKNENKIKKLDLNFLFGHRTKNDLFLNKNNWFVGLNNFTHITQQNTFIKDSSEANRDNLNLYINPTVSIGKGRIEPIYYARKSWDIEKALLKSNTITKPLTNKQRTVLANKIAIIQSKRFFDGRLSRIYLLETIDSVLQDMDIIEETNMKYYTYLSDAYLYSHNPTRYSGKRFEIGATQGYNLIAKSEGENHNNVIYDLNGFISCDFYLPTSYSIQHNIKASLVAGKKRQFENNYFNDELMGTVFLEYSLGYYPNTRTFLNFKSLLGLNTTNNTTNINTINRFASVSINYSYYISPKFRFNTLCLAFIGSNEVNMYHYHNDYLRNIVLVGVHNPYQNYQFNIGFSYAIL